MAEGIKDELKEIKDLLIEERIHKEKKFRLPFGKKTSARQARAGYVTIMKINENGFIDFKKEKIEEQTLMIDGIPRLSTPDYVLHWKKVPMVIIPSWSTKPFSPTDNYEASEKENNNIKGYKILLDKMKKETIDSKPKMGGMLKWIIGIGLVAVIIYAFVSGGG